MSTSKPTTGAFVLDSKKADLFLAQKRGTSKDYIEKVKAKREKHGK